MANRWEQVYKYDNKTKKWVVDEEKTQAAVKRNNASKKSGGKSSADAIDPVKTATTSSYIPPKKSEKAATTYDLNISSNANDDDKLNDALNARAAVSDIIDHHNAITDWTEGINSNLYKRGGSNAIKNSPIYSDIGFAHSGQGKIREYMEAGEGYLDLSDDQFKELMAMHNEDAGTIEALWRAANARTGHDYVINQATSKQEKQDLQGLYNLSGYDQTTAQMRTNVPDDIKREGINTYQDIANAQKDYSDTDIELDLENVNKFFGNKYIGSQLNGEVLTPQEQEEIEASFQRIQDYSGVDLRGMTYDEWDSGEWYDRAKVGYHADTQALNDIGYDANYKEYSQAHTNEEARKEQAALKGRRFAAEAGELETAAKGVEGYADKSKYIAGKPYWHGVDYGVLWYGQGNYDPEGENLDYRAYGDKVTYSFLNDYVAAAEAGDSAKMAEMMEMATNIPGLSRYHLEALPAMTDDQRKTFYSYINNGDYAGVDDYLNKIDYDISKRANEEWETNRAEQLNGSVGQQIAGTITSFPANFMAGLSGLAMTANRALNDIGFNIGNPYRNHEYNEAFKWQQEADLSRGAMAQTIEEATPWATIGGINIASTAFQGLASVGDSLIAGATGPITGMAILSGGASGRTLQQEMEAGNPNATIYAIGTGAIEAAFEKLGMDALFSGSMKKALFGNALEESGTELGNMLWDVMINQDQNQINKLLDQYRIMGYADKAEFATALDQARNVVEAGLSGMFGGTVGVGSAATQRVYDFKTGRTIQQNETAQPILDIARAVMADNPEVMKLIEQEQAALDAMKANTETAEAETLPERETFEPSGESKITPVEKPQDTKTLPKQEEFQPRGESKITPVETDQESETLKKPEEFVPRGESKINPVKAEQEAEVLPEREEFVPSGESKITPAEAKAAEELAEDAQEAASGKKGKPKKIKTPKVSNAKMGRIFRETYAKLDKKAKRILSDSLFTEISQQLQEKNYKGDVQSTASAIVKMVSGDINQITSEVMQAVASDRLVLGLVNEYTAPIQQLNELSTLGSKGYQKPDADIKTPDEPADLPAVSTVDGKDITVQGIASVSEDGTVMLNVADADGNITQVDAESIEYGIDDEGTAAMARVAGSLGRNADAFLNGISESQNPAEYAEAFETAMNYGRDGRNLDKVQKSDALSSVLNPAQITAAYTLGQNTRQQNARMVRKNVSGIQVGRVDTSGINMSGLNRSQRASVNAVGRLAKAVGFNVRFVESKANALGKYTTENGSWDSATMTMTLDIHAGSNFASDTNYAVMHTAGHELTHFIKDFADSGLWNEYQEFVVGHLSNQMTEAELEGRIQQHMRANPNLNRDGAIEEIIADASGDALLNISETELSQIAESNPGLFSKLKAFFEKWIGNLKKLIDTAYKGTEAKTAEAKAMHDVVDQLSEKWNKMLVNAAQNRNVASETTSMTAEEAVHIDAKTQRAIDNDQAVTADVEIKNSIRMDEQFGADALRINQDNGFVPAATLRKALADRKIIRDIFLDPANRDLLKLPPDIEGDTFVSDSSYGGTEENTTVCIRSMAAQALMDLISQNLGRPLTVQDTLLISQEIAGLTDRPECYYCYVATDRRAYRDFLGQYLEQRDAVIKKYKSGADRAALYEEFLGGRKSTANMKARFNMWLDAVDNGTAMIDGNDLASLENLFGEVDSLRNEILEAAAELSGIDAGKLNIVNGKVRYAKSGKQITATTLKALAKSNPTLANTINRYDQLTDATAYAQSASWAKKMKGYAAYNGHILNWSQKRVNDLNKHYGLRMYSFSDFSPAFILENMQMVTDASVRGLNMLGYTKEMPFAEIFAPSGMNINISTFAYEQGGEVKEDYKQGASWERAKALREKHPNVGIVMVATSDNILEWALRQDWVDVVIPYHLVRTGTDVAEYFGYKNYTGVSADGKGLSFAEKNKGKAKKERVTSVSPVEHRNDLISYVDALQRYGLTPRFASWLKGLDAYLAGEISPKQFREMNPNYMKLVNETRRSYADTAPVQPKFDMSAAKEAIQQMIREGGYYTPVGGSMEAQFEIAGNVADKIRINDGKRFSGRYDYNTLIAKPDMTVTELDTETIIDRRDAYRLGRENVNQYADRYDRNGTPMMYIEDLGKYVIVGRKALEHGLDRRASSQNGVVARIGDILHNSVVINEAIPKKDGVRNSWIMLGVAADGDGNLMYVRSVVNQSTMEVDEVSSLYAVLGKKNKAGRIIAPDGRTKGSGVPSNLTISIADLLKNVNGLFDDVISEDVAKHIGIERSTSEFTDRLRFQKRDFSELSDRELLVEALQTELTPAERDHLERYSKKVEDLNRKQMMLEDLNEEIIRLRAGARDFKSREALRKAEENAKTLRNSITNADRALAKIESADMIRTVIKRNREEVRRKTAARYHESYGKEKYRARIREDAKKLYNWVASPTNKGYVPEFLRKPLADFIDSIDYTSARQLRGGAETKNDRRFADALENLRRAVGEINKQQVDIEGGATSFAGYIDLPSDYMQEFDELVGKIKTTLDMSDNYTDTPFAMMTAEQLHDLSKMFRILNSSVSKVNRLIVNGRYESAKTAANDTITDMTSMSAKVKTNKLLSTLNSMFNWKNSTPIMAFQKMGRGAKAIFEGLQDGWDKMAQNSAQLIEYAENTFAPQQAKAWSKDIKRIKLDSGDSFQITAAQAMSLYCLSKREQAVGHLMGGGIRISDIDMGKGNTLSQVDDYILSEADLARIIGTLTAEQKAVADKLQHFMNTVCTDWGNEISMKRFGYKMFTEKFYFPIETDANNRSKIDDKQSGETSLFRLLNMSAMKPLTKNANNAIIVRDIFDVFTNHASDIGKYNALALPILDFIKWYNFVEKVDVLDANGNPTGKFVTKGTQKALEHAYGQDAKQYLLQFIRDLNGEHDGGRNDGILSKLMGHAKAGSVSANMRVAMLQPTSLPRAAYAINPKYLLKGMAKVKSLNPATAIKGSEAQEEIGILKWKALGFYSTDVSRSTRGMVRRDAGAIDKIRDLIMKPAEWGDNWTSNIIYEAVKAEMADKHPNVKPGTKAYDTMLNKRVREIVYKTQVVDSTMTRSDFMRSKGMMTAFTAFMSEPTLTVNMLNESIQEAVMNARTGMNARDNLRNVGGKAVRAATVMAFTATTSAFVEAIFDALRDDDDYEKFREKFADAFGGNVADNVNIFAMLPIIKDTVVPLVKKILGADIYDSNSLATQVYDQAINVVESIEAWQDGKRPIYSVIYNMLQVGASATGIGVQNATRDAVGLYNAFLADAFDTPKIQTYSDSKSKAAEELYEALRNGDDEKLEWIQHRAEVNGIALPDISEKIGTLIKEEYLAGDISDEEAARRLVEYGGKSEDDAYWKIQEWGYSGEGNFSKYTALGEAIKSGDRNAATAAYKELADHGADEKTIANQLSKMYNNGEATNILSLQLRSNNLYTSNLKLKTDGEKHPDDFDAFITAIVNGSGISAQIDALMDKGYTVKQCMSAINGAFGNSSDRYRIMEKYNGADARILLDRILTAYEALGLDRDEEIAWIDANWHIANAE